MRYSSRAAAAIAAVWVGSAALAQQIADPGFKSVGRGAPLKADLRNYEVVGATIPVTFENGKAVEDPKRIARAVQRFITEDTSNEMNALISQFWSDDAMTPEQAQAKFVDILKNSD